MKKKKQVRESFSKPHIPNSESWAAGASPAAQGTGGDLLLCHRVHSHPEPHSHRLGQWRHVSSPHVHIFRIWEETHPDMGRICNLYTDSGPHQESIIFLISIMTKPSRMK